MRKVFKDWTVLLVSRQLTQESYLDLMAPFEFGRIEAIVDDKQAVNIIKKMKPHMVVAASSLPVFTGPQILSATRNDEKSRHIPFVIIGVKEDTKPGGLAESVEKSSLAKFVGLPMNQDQINAIVLSLADEVIDPNQEQAYELFEKAEKILNEGDLIEAAEIYEKGMDLYDGNLHAWVKLAGILAEMEAFDESEDAFIKALSINKYALEAYIGMADLYERRGDYEQTISVLKQALGISRMMKVSKKSMARINYFIGEFELRLERLAGAEEHFERAIADDPEDSGLRIDIGDSYAEKGYYAESEQHYEAALEIDPNLAHVFNRLGIAYRRQQKYEKAQQLYDSARVHHPDDEHLLFNIARAHLEDVKHTEALQAIEKALDLKPGFKEAKHLASKLRSVLNQVDLDG